MLPLRNRLGATLIGSLFAITCGVPALADDSEIYVNSNTSQTAARPNILFVVDTSTSMTERDVTGERRLYDRNHTWGTQGNCKNGNIFFRAEGDPIPDCSSTNFIVDSNNWNMCSKMITAVRGVSGRWTGKVAQYDETNQIWRDLQPATGTPPAGVNQYIECAADDGVHGSNASPTQAVHARNGDRTKRWSNDASTTIDWNQRKTYTFYSSNWLNWRRLEPEDKTLSRMDAVKQSVIDMVSSVDGVNLGLMRYSYNREGGERDASGGYVAAPVADITANRADLISKVNGFTADGYTPLAETMWEAAQYYRGRKVDFGANSKPEKSISTSWTGPNINSATYKSPIIGQCQKNYIIYLTDGLPTRDREVEAPERMGSCTPPNEGQSGGGNDPRDGNCFDDIAGWLANNDVSETVPNADDGTGQTVVTYTIGFGRDVKGAALLDRVATAGKGSRFDAENTDQLTEALTKITNDVLNVSTTFTTASVGVNAFNRTQTRDDLYFALFAPKETLRWEGNLKKFKLAVDNSDAENPRVIIKGQDAGGSAVDESTGRFRETARSFWSSTEDGNDVTAGGAAENLPAAANRKLYTYLGNNPAGTSSAALLALSNASVNDAILGTASGTPTRAQLMEFVYGNESKRMGDPMHSEPVVVTYGGTADAPIDVVYVATNDGFVHAIDPADNSGKEKWAFIPSELLPRVKQLYNNEGTPNRTYGLDGDLRILRLDRNENGKIEPEDGDLVWLFVAMRRGGNHLYALDITRPDNPRMLWIAGGSDPAGRGYSVLPGLGETWSTPTIARVNIAGAAQNNQKLVLIFGGGYDATQETEAQADDTVGNRVFMVDAKTGALLWYAAPNAGPPGDASKLLAIEDMKHSIPARIAVIDTNGDLFADRMYAADMGGRIFRFDIFNGKNAKELVTGGVFAELGQGHVTGTRDVAETRRFYNAPDVALIQRRGEDPYYNIAIGSGYRGHPLSKATLDYFYSLRDKQPFVKLTSQQYEELTPVRSDDDGLIDITSNPAGAEVTPADKGWKLALYTGGVMKGQKVLATSTTVDDVILFSTFEPVPPGEADPCRPRTHNRAYAVKVDNGRPALNLNNDAEINNDDLYDDVPMDGILGKINVGVLRGELGQQLQAGKDGPTPPTVCLAGMHVLGNCVQVNDSIRTYWRKDVDKSN